MALLTAADFGFPAAPPAIICAGSTPLPCIFAEGSITYSWLLVEQQNISDAQVSL